MTQASRFRALLRRDGMVVAPGAYDCITAKLIEQAGFAAVYMTAINPIVSPRLDANGALTFENAAVAANAAKAPAGYRATWMRYDNTTDQTERIGDTQSATTAMAAPAGLPTATGAMVAVDIAVDSDAYPAWKKPARAYFRRANAGWMLIGFERMPDRADAGTGVRSN